MFLPTPTLILHLGSPRLRDNLLLHRQQNKYRWSYLHKLWNMTILEVTMIPRPRFCCAFTLQSKLAPTQSIYQLTVSSLPECNCPAFKDTISKFGRKRNSFLHCKHMYFIFIKVPYADPEVDLFIHAHTFSFNEVKLILEGCLLIQSIS